MRALVLHETLMGDNCVSACEGTAKTVIVCRTISPFHPSHLNDWVYMAIFERGFGCAGLLAFALVRLRPLVCQIPPTASAWSICSMMHGLAISLPESALVQSPRGSVLAPARICTLERGQALTLGSRPPEARAVTAGGVGISTAAGPIVERLPHGELVQTRISNCVGGARMT